MTFPKNSVLLLSAILFLSACASYYQQQANFNQKFTAGNLEAAKRYLEQHDKQAEKKDRLLYFLDRGVVEHLLGNYQESNFYFEEAYIFTQDFRKSFSGDFLEMTANPMLRPYRGEDFEVVLIHFYKTLNFIKLGRLNDALIEVRRINIKLNKLNDRYEDKKNRYKVDAFALNLMGMIYEARGNYNDAFIAYRNAYVAYAEVYADAFNVSVPQQLKHDLIRMAAYNGFRQEQEMYEKQFGIEYQKQSPQQPMLNFFWLNGLGPVKGEFSLNLTSLSNGQNGVLTFANEAEGFSIPVNSNQLNGQGDLNDLNFIRMAVPRYNTRQPMASGAAIVYKEQNFPLALAEDIESIARSTLKDRLARELAKSVGRLAIKQAAQAAVRKENEDLGSLVSILNAVTEKADTRNWQSLPHSISYVRIPLDTAVNDLKLSVNYANGQDTIRFKWNANTLQDVFLSHHSLGSSKPII